MTPDRQAQLLSHWLHQEPGGAVPDELDEDVVEAVYALRPDLAPAPRLTIEQILEEVHEGPLALSGAARPDAAQVQALMAWLEAVPGRRPGPEVDPDVVEAVYALRPDLAPAPTLSLDDILGAVTTGPFAAATAPPPAEPLAASQPATAAAPTTAPAAARPRQAPPGPERRRAAPATRRLPTWLVPSLGAAAVAATALLLVVPMRGRLAEAPSPFDAAERMATPAPAPPMASAPAARPPAAATEASPTDAPAAEPLALEPDGAAAPADATLDTLRDDRVEARAGAGSVALPVAGATAGDAVEAAGGPGARQAQGGEAAREAKASSSPVEEAPLADDELRADAPAAALAPATTGSSAAWSESDADQEGLERQAGSSSGRARAEESLGQSAERRKSADRGGLLSSKKEAAAVAQAPAPAAEAPSRSAPASAADLADEAELAEAPAPPQQAGPTLPSPATAAGPAGLSLAQLRAAAWPLGGFPDPTVGRPDVAAAHAAAAEADAQGDPAGFVAALRPLLSHASADVALDAGYRIARRQQANGDLSGALVTVNQALARGGAGLQRARLLALQGELHERRGDPERAADSYRAAVQAR